MASPLKAFPASGTQSNVAYNREVHRRELRLAMEGKTTLVTPEQFLADFLPQPRETRPESLSGVLSKLKKTTTEWKMYDPLMAALNGASSLCPGFKFVATPSKSDKSSNVKQSFDCG
ncbi:hypothetical protein C8Q77DRAFT_1066918, partial [Trametes polyzona]